MNRRTAVRRLTALACAGGLSGCLSDSIGQSDEQTPTPVDLSGNKLDDRGGMVIGVHGGPNGQIFYANDAPDGHENPAWFHTLAFGLFPYYFEHRRAGWEATVIYVTDYSAVEYEVSGGDQRKSISAPTAPETFGEATGMQYVIESEVSGGMGPALIPFAVPDDARAFVDEYGGRTIAFEEITPVFVTKYAER